MSVQFLPWRTLPSGVTDDWSPQVMEITGLSMAARAKILVDPTEGAKAFQLPMSKYPPQGSLPPPMPTPADIRIFRVTPRSASAGRLSLTSSDDSNNYNDDQPCVITIMINTITAAISITIRIANAALFHSPSLLPALCIAAHDVQLVLLSFGSRSATSDILFGRKRPLAETSLDHPRLGRQFARQHLGP